MAYNSGFPVGYQPYYPQYQYQNSQVGTPQQHSSSIIWVQGEAGAKSYMVAPNTTVQLWDSESQTIYLKSADASGMPSMRILDYTIRSEAHTSPVQGVKASDPINVSREDLNALQSQIDTLKDEVRACRQTIAESEVYHEQSDLRRRHERKNAATANESNADASES